MLAPSSSSAPWPSPEALPPRPLPLGVGPPPGGLIGPPPRPPVRSWSLRSPLVAVLVIVLVAGGVVGVRAVLDEQITEALDRIFDRGRLPATEDVDEPDERVAVTTDVAGRVAWTMQSAPNEELGDSRGGAIPVEIWVAGEQDGGEVVAVYDVGSRTADLDSLLRHGFGGADDVELGQIERTTADGYPARSARFRGSIDGGGTAAGRVMVVAPGRVAVLMVVFGAPSERDVIDEQHAILVRSLRIG